jgi:hypothetical protein
VVKAGDVVNPRVVDVDLEEKKFTLSLQSDAMLDREKGAMRKFGKFKAGGKDAATAPAASTTVPAATSGGAGVDIRLTATLQTAGGKKKRSAVKQAARNARRLAKKP